MSEFLVFLRNILQLILSPSRGWEDVGASGAEPRRLTRDCLYPMIAAAALTVPVQRVYDADLSVAVIVMRMFIVFTSFFAGVYFSILMFRTFFHDYTEGEPNETKYTTMIVYIVSMLALSTLICNMMPVDLGFSFLLPMAVTLVMWKAYVYLRVEPRKELLYLVFGFLTVVLPPMALQMLFNIFI